MKAKPKLKLRIKIPPLLEPLTDLDPALVSPLGLVPIPEETEPFPDFFDSMEELEATERAEREGWPKRIRLVCKPESEADAAVQGVESSETSPKRKRGSRDSDKENEQGKRVGKGAKRQRVALKRKAKTG